jgi:uncharacterized glyoxalase superfamily protein PhnB
MLATYPAVISMIAYEDGPAASEWLTKAFGFRERAQNRHIAKDGTISHAEMEQGGVIMLPPILDSLCGILTV